MRGNMPFGTKYDFIKEIDKDRYHKCLVHYGRKERKVDYIIHILFHMKPKLMKSAFFFISKS
jgi:hypothetical protein